jgi:hypothetical protein
MVSYFAVILEEAFIDKSKVALVMIFNIVDHQHPYKCEFGSHH